MKKSFRAALAGLIVAPLTGVVTLGMAGTADADPFECEPNTTWTKVRISTKPWKLTHVGRIGVAPGTKYEEQETAIKVRTITAGITKYGEGSVSAGGVLAKAEVKAGVSLADNNATTRTKSVTKTVTFESGKKKRVYALFRGNRKWTGGFDKYRCSSDGRNKHRVAYGTWRTFGARAQETTLCKRGSNWLGDNYAKGTLDRLACDAIR